MTMTFWASSFVVIRALGDTVDPGPMALGRLLVGSAVLTALVLLRRARRAGRRTPPLPRGRALAATLGYGALWFGVYTVTVNAAGRLVDAGTTAMLVNLAPVLVALLAGFLLREGFPPQLLLGLLVAFAGVLLIASASWTGRLHPLGVGLALAAAGLYAVGVLLQKQALATAEPLTVTWLGCLAGTAVTLPFAGTALEQLGGRSWPATLGVVYLGIFPTAVAFLLWTYALSRTSAGRMAASSYVVPGIAVLLSWLFLAETPTAVALLGGAVSLAGVALTRLRRPARR
ncbi:EamA family transporter [Auraticoccus sp. F435]|uniref:EamA family transporter n=1 Tax=Auraticoccus cholistanensis TaxID=2656650 RepID=A0A6A9UXN9_9ACTN|nr:EamA family transporter [Auraticoccus cholistanensis]